MAGTMDNINVGCLKALVCMGFVLLIGASGPLVAEGLKEGDFRDREVPGGKLIKPGKSGDLQRDGRARTLQKKCLAMVNKKTPQRHVYLPGSLRYGQGAHPSIFMVYLETAAHHLGQVGEQWSACGFNSINNLSYLRVHRKVVINRP